MYLFSKSRLKVIWVLITIWVSALILMNASIYFRSGPTPIFLLEKGDLRFDSLWRTAFFFHVIGACVCLAIGPLLMIRRLIRYQRLHAVLGYTYVNAVIWVAGPTGMIISPTAKGGALAALGFLVTGLFWWLSTWLGYRAIKKNEMTSHIRWMVRSYSIALTAVWFRIIQIGLSFAFNNTSSYIAAVWLSLLVSIWVSETCISRHFKTKTHSLNWISNLAPLHLKGKLS